MRAARSLPGGVPLRPPVGWRPDAPTAMMSPLTLACLVVFMMAMCMAVGWITVRLPRRGSAPGQATEASPPAQPEEKGLPKDLTFERDVMPILQRSCVSCHGRSRKRGGLDLSTLAAIRRGGDNGAVLAAGKPDDSSLYESITAGRMPPKKPQAVTPTERRLIREWIARGAK